MLIMLLVLDLLRSGVKLTAGNLTSNSPPDGQGCGSESWNWDLHTLVAAGHLVIPNLQEKTHVAATSDGNHPWEELQLPIKYLQCLVHQEFFLEMV